MKPILLLLCILLIGSCKKDEFNSSQIDFKDAPLAVIKASMRGTWRVYETSGGLSGQTTYPEDFYMGFDYNAVEVIRGVELNRIEVVWNKKVSILKELTYVMESPNGGFYKVPAGISNDTLVLYDNFPDGDIYLLTRSEDPK